MTLLGTCWVLGVGDPEVHKAQPFLLPPTPSFVFTALHSVCAEAVAAGYTLRPLNAEREAHFRGEGYWWSPRKGLPLGENPSVEGDSLGAGFLPLFLF